MRNLLKRSWAWVVGFLLVGTLGIFLWPTSQGETYLYLIYDEGRAGEKNQVLGVANALTSFLPDKTIKKEFTLKNKDALLLDIPDHLKPESKDKGIIVATEVESIDVLKQIPSQQNVVISHSSHQYTPNHAGLKNVAHVVALPRYVVTPDIQGAIESQQTVLIQTPGVPSYYVPKKHRRSLQKE